MGQVPRRPLGIVGDGKLARHFKEYFRLLGIPVSQWSRRIEKETGLRVEQALEDCSVILLLIKDSAIEAFWKEHPFLHAVAVHCSGALALEGVPGFHPLMTFGEELYDRATYEAIPFVGETCAPSFREIFPQLNNPSFAIPRDQKAYYHALCVLAGNFTVLLWQKFFAEMEGRYGIPHDSGALYLQQITHNLSQSPKEALTGPIPRKDLPTLEKNLRALKGDSYEEVYRAFVKAALPEVELK